MPLHTLYFIQRVFLVYIKELGGHYKSIVRFFALFFAEPGTAEFASIGASTSAAIDMSSALGVEARSGTGLEGGRDWLDLLGGSTTGGGVMVCERCIGVLAGERTGEGDS